MARLMSIFGDYRTEPEYTLTHHDDALSEYPAIRMIQIAKVGGGTVGRAYTGDWIYRVTFMDHDRLPEQGADLTTGMPHTHHEAATLAVEFFTPED